MAWKPMSTKDVAMNEPHKLLVYTHHGWGKTWQVRKFAERYGKGLLISGEAGLKSLADVDVDYLPFSSWDGRHDPDNGVFSFRGIVQMIVSPEFQAQGYKWLAIDSLTELSERLYEWCEKETAGSKNGFALWDLYGGKMISTLKWIRDLKMHVYVSALAAEANDGEVAQYWPLVKGNKVARQIPAIFDHVLCGVRTAVTNPSTGEVDVKRFVVSEQANGWHGKVRDPFHRVAAVEQCDDVTDILERMTYSEAEWDKRKEALKVTAATAEAIAKLTAGRDAVAPAKDELPEQAEPTTENTENV